MDYLKNNIYNIEMGVPGFYSWYLSSYFKAYKAISANKTLR